MAVIPKSRTRKQIMVRKLKKAKRQLNRLVNNPANRWIKYLISGGQLIFKGAVWIIKKIERRYRQHVFIAEMTRRLREDEKQNITTDIHVAQYNLNHNQSDRGIFLTMTPPNKKLGYAGGALTYDDDRHVILIAGSRGHKGVAIIVPNILHHKGSLITYDPSGENVKITAAYRQKVLGQKTIVLDPLGMTDQPSHSWNALAEIDFENDPQALDKCYALAESLIESTGKDPFWHQSAQELVAMTCAYVGVRSVIENVNLPTVYEVLHRDDLTPLWMAMSETEGLDGAIKRYGAGNLNRDERELSSVVQTAKTGMRFMASSAMKKVMQKSSFSMKELKQGNISIYVVMPVGEGDTYRGWLRLLFNMAFGAMQDTSIPTPEHPTLFLVDEFPTLGRMDRFLKASGEAAKFGVKLFLCAQDIPQLKNIWSDSWESLVANGGMLIMFSNADLTTQEYLSKKIGKHYALKVTHNTTKTTGESSNASDTNPFGKGQSKSVSNTTSKSEELRDNIRPDQVASYVGRNTGNAFFLTPEHKPMCLPRARYFDWDMIPEGLEYDPSNPSTDKGG